MKRKETIVVVLLPSLVFDDDPFFLAASACGGKRRKKACYNSLQENLHSSISQNLWNKLNERNKLALTNRKIF